MVVAVEFVADTDVGIVGVTAALMGSFSDTIRGAFIAFLIFYFSPQLCWSVVMVSFFRRCCRCYCNFWCYYLCLYIDVHIGIFAKNLSMLTIYGAIF